MAQEKVNWYTPKDCKFSIGEQISEIDRELKMRYGVYQQQIRNGKLDRKRANEQYVKLADARKSLKLLQKVMTGKQPELNL